MFNSDKNTEKTHLMKVHNVNINNRSVIFGLKGSNIMEYIVLVLIIIIVVYLASMLFNKLHN